MVALYAKLIKSLLLIIVLYGAPALYIVIKLSEYYKCDSNGAAPLICTIVVIVFVVVLVLLMRVFVFPIYDDIEIRRSSDK